MPFPHTASGSTHWQVPSTQLSSSSQSRLALHSSPVGGVSATQAPSSQISPVAHSSSFSHASPGGDGSDLASSLPALTVSPTLTQPMSDNIHVDHCVFMTTPDEVAPNARAESPGKASSRRKINAKGYVVRRSRQKKRPHALLLQATRYPCE